MSAEILREAAASMRSRAEKATSGPWEFRPRRGFQSVSENPATIGFTDTAGYFVMLREGTWAAESDMIHIASWHPAVALAVADWLEWMAERATSGNDIPAMRGLGFEHAVAAARAYLGTTPAQTGAAS